MRLRYREERGRIYLRIEDRVEDESRVWRMLQMSGVPLSSEKDPRGLAWRRHLPREAFAKLARAAQMLKADLAPEEGEAPLGAPTRSRQAYEAARPFDAGAVLAAAKGDPHGGEAALHAARVKLAAFRDANPAFAREADEDVKALDAALAIHRDAAAGRAAAEAAAGERDVAERLRGVSAEDAWAAHEALRALRAAAQRLESAARSQGSARVPDPIPGFCGRLRPYQREGVEFLVSRGLNAILADEMGLGKTVMAIAAVCAAGERALVVAPANVLYNWADEVERFTGERAVVFHERRKMGPAGARFLVTTYDALRSAPWMDPDLVERPVLVLDEAHLVRNAETQRSAIVRALPQRRRILLTGTPLVNTIEDYFELLRQVDGGRFGSRERFRDEWLVDPALFNKYAEVRSVTASLLQRAARDVLLRRRKDDVLPDLPPRTVSLRRHDLEGDAYARYRALESRMREVLEEGANDVAVFAAIHALRHHLATHRVPAVEERLRELLDAGESVVAYSHYLDPLHALRDRLGNEAAVIEGATPPRERQAIARAFGRDGGARVLLAQMEAGGIGLNLTAARHVLFVHFGWTPAAHSQAMDRVHRIGQDRPVLVEFFLTPGTIDERMARILLRKEADQNLVLADESDLLNRAELARILAADAAERAAEEKRVAGLG